MAQPDPAAYFRLLDSGTERAFAALERKEGSANDRRAIVLDIVQSSFLRMCLFEHIVLPALRKAKVEPSLLDQAQADGQAIVSIAEAIEDADEDLFHPCILELAGRFRRRVKADELELWPAARRSSADLVEIANRLEWAWGQGISRCADE